MRTAYELLKRGVSLLDNVNGYKAVDRRIAGEKSVVRAAVRNAIKTGHTVSLNDGCEWTVKGSSSEVEVMSATYSTDADYLLFRKAGQVVGKVYLVYGNSASEVICDHTDSEAMEAILAPATRRADKYAALGL
ncbi:hypothetical protein D3C86_1387040 [compost metagenome]